MPLGLTIKKGSGIEIKNTDTGETIEIFYSRNRGRDTIGLVVFSDKKFLYERIEKHESKKGFTGASTDSSLFEKFRVRETDDNTNS